MHDGQPQLIPSEVELKLQVAIFRLLDAKYHAEYGAQTKFLCAAILNWAFLNPVGNDNAQEFLGRNEILIKQEAEKLHFDSRLATALSVLYTFTLIRLGPKQPERTMDLVVRATELNIVISSAKELCPTDDAIQFLYFVDEYASRLLGE